MTQPSAKLRLGVAGEVLRVKLLRPGARLPSRATPGATGLDLYACLDTPGYVDVGPEVTLIPTGIAVEAPLGFDLQIRQRSSLAKLGVLVVLGTVDSDYRGELLVAMHAVGRRAAYRVRHGDRVAQLVVSRVEIVEVVEAGELTPTARGEGGYGSTGR